MAWRPPASINVKGKTIVVKLATAEELRDVVADHKTPWGAWDDELETIFILKTASPMKRNESYWHEVLHCLIDVFLDPPR